MQPPSLKSLLEAFRPSCQTEGQSRYTIEHGRPRSPLGKDAIDGQRLKEVRFGLDGASHIHAGK